jgi:hypothetical protein
MTKYESRRLWNKWEMALKVYAVMIGFAIFASIDVILGRLS